MVISARDLTIRPTQHGLLFLGILLAMLLGSINYNNNAGFILVFLLGSMGMISLVHSYKNLIGMRVRISGPSPVFAGQTGLFPVDIISPGGSGQAISLSFESYDEVQFSPGKDAENRGSSASSVSSVSSVSVPFETRARVSVPPEISWSGRYFPSGFSALRPGFPTRPSSWFFRHL